MSSINLLRLHFCHSRSEYLPFPYREPVIPECLYRESALILLTNNSLDAVDPRLTARGDDGVTTCEDDGLAICRNHRFKRLGMMGWQLAGMTRFKRLGMTGWQLAGETRIYRRKCRIRAR